MGTQLDQEKLKAMATELAKDIKSEKDLGALTQQLVKLTVETALNAELDEHLGYEKHAPEGRGTGNSRNGYSAKRLKGQHGEVAIEAPRDRDGSFEPQFVRKGQSRLTQMDDQILALYLNEIYLGRGSYGVAAAALKYFDKSLNQLDLQEMAYLAALPKAPNNYHPINNLRAAVDRRNWVLREMQQNGYIS